jgi:hypothetical protein
VWDEVIEASRRVEMPRGKARFSTMPTFEVEGSPNISPIVSANNREVPDVVDMNPSASLDAGSLSMLHDDTAVRDVVKELGAREDCVVKELDDSMIVDKGVPWKRVGAQTLVGALVGSLAGVGNQRIKGKRRKDDLIRGAVAGGIAGGLVGLAIGSTGSALRRKMGKRGNVLEANLAGTVGIGSAIAGGVASDLYDRYSSRKKEYEGDLIIKELDDSMIVDKGVGDYFKRVGGAMKNLMKTNPQTRHLVSMKKPSISILNLLRDGAIILGILNGWETQNTLMNS